MAWIGEANATHPQKEIVLTYLQECDRLDISDPCFNQIIRVENISCGMGRIARPNSEIRCTAA